MKADNKKNILMDAKSGPGATAILSVFEAAGTADLHLIAGFDTFSL